MKESFRLIVQFSSHLCTIQADKIITPFSIDFVILNDDPDLLQKTGIKQVIFHYETFDKHYRSPKISYRHRKPEIQVPHLPFEHAITEGIKMHEGVCIVTPAAEPSNNFRIL